MKSAARFKRLKLTVADVIKPMVVLLMLNVIVLTVWTVIDPLQRNTIVVSVDRIDRDLETFGVCGSDHGYIFLGVLCLINLGSLIVATIQAYQARNMSTELHESSYIFIAMALILLVSFIGVPVLFIARDNTQAYYFVTAGLVFVVCSSILLLIFVPKVCPFVSLHVMILCTYSYNTKCYILFYFSSSCQRFMRFTTVIAKAQQNTQRDAQRDAMV